MICGGEYEIPGEQHSDENLNSSNISKACHSDLSLSETCPLVQSGRQEMPNESKYQTFSKQSMPKARNESIVERMEYLWKLDFESRKLTRQTVSKKIVLVGCLVVVVFTTARHVIHSRQRSSGFGLHYDNYHTSSNIQADVPVWLWDHNMFVPHKNSTIGSTGQLLAASGADDATTNGMAFARERQLLMAQVKGDHRRGANEMMILDEISDISSRPNRAYARQWGHNYVRYTQVLNRSSCWDDGVEKATFLKTVLFHQERNQDAESVSYDIVALLPPGTIVMDLDFDLLELMPNDKLLAVALADNLTSVYQTGLVFINLRHGRASRVISRWLDELNRSTHHGLLGRSSGGRSCRHVNHGLESLLEAVEFVLEPKEAMKSLVSTMDSLDGFILEPGSNAFCFQNFLNISSMDDVLSSPAETISALQTTADSVCYRYYPKCEVL